MDRTSDDHAERSEQFTTEDEQSRIDEFASRPRYQRRPDVLIPSRAESDASDQLRR